MSKGKPLEELERSIGYTFRNPAYLQTAMTHSSYINENKNKGADASECNERLEFLGDAVLQILISEHLYQTFPDCAEGYLTQFRQHLVCERTLARVATSISLGDYLDLGRGEEMSNGRQRASILADCFEAFLAAIYLDCREEGVETPRRLLLQWMENELRYCTNIRDGDYKTRLQQLVQQDGTDTLSYQVVREEGPAHDRTFEVEARINSNVVGKGVGHSKREAEQLAARRALELFGVLLP